MSDDDTRHSGSRWEPTLASGPARDAPAADVPAADVPAADVPAKDKPAVDDQADAASREAVDDGPARSGTDDETITDRMALAAAHHAPRPWPVVLPAVPLGGSYPPAPPRWWPYSPGTGTGTGTST